MCSRDRLDGDVVELGKVILSRCRILHVNNMEYEVGGIIRLEGEWEAPFSTRITSFLSLLP